jgi:hypothetical protein
VSEQLPLYLAFLASSITCTDSVPFSRLALGKTSISVVFVAFFSSLVFCWYH